MRSNVVDIRAIEDIKQDAIDTIKRIDIGNLTKDTFILLGASLAILNHPSTDEREPSATLQRPAWTAIGRGEIAKSIGDELHSAEKYLSVFQETGDRDFLQMAYDRTTHCAKFIILAEQQSVDVSNSKQQLKDLQEDISKL